MDRNPSGDGDMNELFELETICTRCNGEGAWTEQGEWADCFACGGAGYVPTVIGQKVLDLMWHNLQPKLRAIKLSEETFEADHGDSEAKRPFEAKPVWVSERLCRRVGRHQAIHEPPHIASSRSAQAAANSGSLMCRLISITSTWPQVARMPANRAARA